MLGPQELEITSAPFGSCAGNVGLVEPVGNPAIQTQISAICRSVANPENRPPISLQFGAMPQLPTVLSNRPVADPAHCVPCSPARLVNVWFAIFTKSKFAICFAVPSDSVPVSSPCVGSTP